MMIVQIYCASIGNKYICDCGLSFMLTNDANKHFKSRETQPKQRNRSCSAWPHKSAWSSGVRYWIAPRADISPTELLLFTPFAHHGFKASKESQAICPSFGPLSRRAAPHEDNSASLDKDNGVTKNAIGDALVSICSSSFIILVLYPYELNSIKCKSVEQPFQT